MSVVGFGLIGVCAVILVTVSVLGTGMPVLVDMVTPLLTGFALGASSIALFMRVGGGIYTKAADIGADLVGKLEAGIPEDDPRNPATIADNVGDNVGDVAGMGADLFESYVGALVGSMIIGSAVAGSEILRLKLMGLPLVLCGLGVLASIAGTFLVRARPGGSPQRALNMGTFGAAILAAALAWPATRLMIGDATVGNGVGRHPGIHFVHRGACRGCRHRLHHRVLHGNRAAARQGHRSRNGNGARHDHHHRRRRRNALQHAGCPGPCRRPPGKLRAGRALRDRHCRARHAGNARHPARRGRVRPHCRQRGRDCRDGGAPAEVRRITDSLDAVGNTTAAIGKGFAIGSAALAAISLFSAFKEQTGSEIIDIANIHVLAGIIIGAGIPFFFSSMAIGAIGRAAFAMIQEVRRQFRERPGILAETESPDYNRCIDISTRSALREMILPGSRRSSPRSSSGSSAAWRCSSASLPGWCPAA